MNRSKDLKSLFNESLRNKLKKSCNKSYIRFYDESPNSNNNEGNANNDSVSPVYRQINIRFYEWSNVSVTPRCFYSISTFDEFLSSSSIHLKFFEREMIANLGSVYISCYRGTKRLCIRSNYQKLSAAMDEYNESITNINNDANDIDINKIRFENDMSNSNGVECEVGTWFG